MIAFFVHEFVEDLSPEYLQAVSEYQKAKDKRTEALNNLKDAAKHLPEYSIYEKESIATDKAFEIAEAEGGKLTFGKWKTFQRFAGEFFWAFGLFIYAMYNLVKNFLKKEDEDRYHKSFVDSVLIYISGFFMYYAVMYKSDYSKSFYIISGIFVTLLIIAVTHHLVKSYIRKQERKTLFIREVFHFLWRDAEDKDLINKQANKFFDFREIRLKLTNYIIKDD